jgi:hypothetical protein
MQCTDYRYYRLRVKVLKVSSRIGTAGTWVKELQGCRVQVLQAAVYR